jgi:hypothetical protein
MLERKAYKTVTLWNALKQRTVIETVSHAEVTTPLRGGYATNMTTE